MDWPQAESGHEALESQRRWLNIAAMEPDPARRAEALEQAKAEGDRAIGFAVEAVHDFDRAMSSIERTVNATPEDMAKLSAQIREQAKRRR